MLWHNFYNTQLYVKKSHIASEIDITDFGNVLNINDVDFNGFIEDLLCNPLVCIMLVGTLLVLATYVFEYYYTSYGSKCFDNVWDAKTRKVLYNLLFDVQQCLECSNVRHFACFGTLLGIVRHQDTIPWDDDVDIAYIDKDEEKLYKALTLLKARGIECVTARESLVGGKYYRLFYKSSENMPFNQGKWPYIDLFRAETQYNDNVTQCFIYPSGKKEFDTASLFPIRKRKFGPLAINTPNQPFAHLNAEFGKAHGPNGYMNTAIGTSFHHRTQLPSLCSQFSKQL